MCVSQENAASAEAEESGCYYIIYNIVLYIIWYDVYRICNVYRVVSWSWALSLLSETAFFLCSSVRLPSSTRAPYSALALRHASFSGLAVGFGGRG